MAINSKKLKIGIVLDSSLDLEDGVQQYVMAVGEWFRRQGHDTHYLVGETTTRQLPNIHSLSRNIVVKFNGNRINLPLWGDGRRIKQLLGSQQFDILYVQTPYHPLMAQRIIRNAPRKTVIIGSFNILPHSRFVALANRALRLLLWPSLGRIDKMLAVSAAAARFEQQALGLPAEVSPNVFRYDIFHTAKPFPRYDDDIPTVLFLGRLVPRKGCLTLLQAVASLRAGDMVPNFRVLVCGAGPLESQLRQFVKDNNLVDVVEFTGFVSEEDKPRFYASADIAVFPSNGGESFGIVLLEAMASGRAAVLAGDNPGYRSVMEPQPELLFDPTDETVLSDCLKRLLTDEPRRQHFADWGATYSGQFDVELVGQQLEALYFDLLERKKLQ